MLFPFLFARIKLIVFNLEYYFSKFLIVFYMCNSAPLTSATRCSYHWLLNRLLRFLVLVTYWLLPWYFSYQPNLRAIWQCGNSLLSKQYFTLEVLQCSLVGNQVITYIRLVSKMSILFRCSITLGCLSTCGWLHNA